MKITATTSITLQVGASSLTMKSDGTIMLSGNVVDIEGKTIINLNK